MVAPNSQPPDGTDLSKAGISITSKGHLPALRAILRQHDGAAYVSSVGKIESIGHQLRYSDNAAKFIQQTGGTRHTSAKRYSFDETRVVIVVVSEEGPGSVFSDGVKVTELAQRDPGGLAAHLRRAIPDKAYDILGESRSLACPTCGKHLEIEVVTVLGWKERETGECPICGATVHSQMCWEITTQLVKRLLQD